MSVMKAKKTQLLIRKAPFVPPPTGRRPIGFRGNHLHGKPLNDPVYPTTKIPTRLIPRFPIDWRNGGRALLSCAMSLIESETPLRRHRWCFRFQQNPHCGINRCGISCSKSPWRCLCSWRVNGKYKHLVNIDELMMKYKGLKLTNKPIFSVLENVAQQNKYKSESMIWNENLNRFVRCDDQGNYDEDIILPGFEYDPTRNTAVYTPELKSSLKTTIGNQSLNLGIPAFDVKVEEFSSDEEDNENFISNYVINNELKNFVFFKKSKHNNSII